MDGGCCIRLRVHQTAMLVKSLGGGGVVVLFVVAVAFITEQGIVYAKFTR